MLCCRYVAVLRFALKVVNRVQYLAYRLTRAEQLVVKLDLLLLVDTLQTLFKNAVRVDRHIQFHSYAQKFLYGFLILVRAEPQAYSHGDLAGSAWKVFFDSVENDIKSCEKSTV